MNLGTRPFWKESACEDKRCDGLVRLTTFDTSLSLWHQISHSAQKKYFEIYGLMVTTVGSAQQVDLKDECVPLKSAYRNGSWLKPFQQNRSFKVVHLSNPFCLLRKIFIPQRGWNDNPSVQTSFSMTFFDLIFFDLFSMTFFHLTYSDFFSIAFFYPTYCLSCREETIHVRSISAITYF